MMPKLLGAEALGMNLAVVILTAASAPAYAQNWAHEVEALKAPATPGRDQVFLDELENRTKAALQSIRHAETPQQAAAARPGLRKQLEEALGLPKMPWPSALNARITGTVVRPGYRIEKIVYQALPGEEVAAHLYIPERLTAPSPAILFYNGHWWAESKTLPDFQAFCITMARRGFVVFSFDPFGQGERGVSTRDHRRVSSLLAGIAQQGFAEHETRCALEYLLSRKEVDRSRIGMTGASGGGYNTWMTSALDDRIKVAVPVVGTSEFYDQIHYSRTVDWYHANEHCHFVPRLIQFANNHELLAMAAPRPVLIINSTTDPGFPIGDVYDYGRRLYRAFGKEDQIAFVHDPTAGHGYQQKKREAAYGWFLKWLMNRGDGSPAREDPVETEAWNSGELKSFGADGKRAAGPVMEAFVKRVADGIVSAGNLKPSEFFRVEVPSATSVRVEPRTAQRIEAPVGPVTIPAFLLRADAAKGLLIAIDDRGKEALVSEPLVQSALARGWSVCGFDVRGIGELATETRGWLFAAGLLAGENLVWRQAIDLLVVTKAIRNAPAFAGKPAALFARGDNAAMAAVYAIGQERMFAWYVLRNGFLSYHQFLDRPSSLMPSFQLLDQDRREERFTAYDREIPYSYFPFDVLHYFDLPQLLDKSGSEGFILEPIDGDWKIMRTPDAQKWLPRRIHVIENISPVEARM